MNRSYPALWPNDEIVIRERAIRSAVLGFAILLGALVLLGLFLCGCAGTVAPRNAEAAHPSWDGANENSGFIGWTNGGCLITPHARDRYNALATLYGSQFHPPVRPNDGVESTPDTNAIFLDSEHLADFAAMNRWLHNPHTNAPAK